MTRDGLTPTRARVLNLKGETKAEREQWREAYPDDGKRRLPMTRGECVEGERPCPLVSCRYHLYLDVNPHNGNIKINFPDVELEDMEETCALDIADRGPQTLEHVGRYTNVTRERQRQVEQYLLPRLREIIVQQGMELTDLLPTSNSEGEEFVAPQTTDTDTSDSDKK